MPHGADATLQRTNFGLGLALLQAGGGAAGAGAAGGRGLGRGARRLGDRSPVLLPGCDPDCGARHLEARPLVAAQSGAGGRRRLGQPHHRHCQLVLLKYVNFKFSLCGSLESSVTVRL